MAEETYKLELSLKEKERRYSLLRDKLKKTGLSALIVYGGTQLGVPVHYLTQVWGSKKWPYSWWRANWFLYSQQQHGYA
jgi:hypothetical protein